MSSSAGYDTLDQKSEAVSTPTAPVNARFVIAAIFMLLVVIIILASLHFCVRWMWGSSIYGQNRRINPAMALQADAGLEKRMLEALPTFVYSSERMKAAMECAVCISEFEENEAGRMLPRCSHCFHTACIDMWLRTHSTCPLCRVRVSDGDEPIATQASVESSRLDEELGVQAASPSHQSQLANTNATAERNNITPNISNVSEEQRRSNTEDFHKQQHHRHSSSDAPLREEMQQNMQDTVNTLLYGDQSVHVSNQAERFQKVEHLVIDIPSREDIFYPARNSGLTPPSSATATDSSKNPKYQSPTSAPSSGC